MKKTAIILILSGMFMILPGIQAVYSADAPAAQAGSSDDEDYLDEAEPRVTVADPLSGLNRAIFEFNDKLYFWALKPIAQGYKAVVPTPVRQGIRNFFHNLGIAGPDRQLFFAGKDGGRGIRDVPICLQHFFWNTGVLGSGKGLPPSESA